MVWYSMCSGHLDRRRIGGYRVREPGSGFGLEPQTLIGRGPGPFVIEKRCIATVRGTAATPTATDGIAAWDGYASVVSHKGFGTTPVVVTMISVQGS